MQHGVNPNLSTNVNQHVLLEKIRRLFPEDQIYENVKKKASLKFSAGTYMQLDIWVPRHKICFEFQDSYHYVSTWYSHISRERIWQKDNIKKNQTHDRGIDLITVPCWWDGTAESLTSTINFQRPGLLQHFESTPVKLNAPLDYFKSPMIPDVGELMLASFPRKHPDFKHLIPSHTWWMGEKYDGVRFCWNPTKRKIFTRTAKEVEVLLPFLALLPAKFIEGEIWFGRGEFSRSFLLLEGGFNDWDTLRMNIFDDPSPCRSLPVPFEVRYASLLHLLHPDHPFSSLVARVHCHTSTHVTSALTGVVHDGGEGLILRRFQSFYNSGRSTDLVKLKNAEGDTEGIVAAVGRSGAVKVKLPNGESFIVPPQNVLVSAPHIGAVVSFSFETHWRRDVPLGPKIFRIRTDVTWEDVVTNHRRGWRQRYMTPTVKEKLVSGRTEYWTDKHMRLFLEDYAKSRNMDPLQPSTWLQTSYTSIRQVPGGRTVLEKFKTGYFPTLLRLFPELRLNRAEFRRDHWGSKANRRKFLETYASAKGFDALNPLHWYNQSMKNILNMKGGGMMDYYNFNLAKALVDLFPNIGIDLAKFGKHR